MITIEEALIGKVFTSVKATTDELVFENDDYKVEFYHGQGCCESVVIDDINGNLSDLENSPITYALESTNSEETFERELDTSHTWTFYKFATAKGWVDVKWLGQSNGYYSESVDMSVSRKDTDGNLWSLHVPEGL